MTKEEIKEFTAAWNFAEKLTSKQKEECPLGANEDWNNAHEAYWDGFYDGASEAHITLSTPPEQTSEELATSFLKWVSCNHIYVYNNKYAASPSPHDPNTTRVYSAEDLLTLYKQSLRPVTNSPRTP